MLEAIWKQCYELFVEACATNNDNRKKTQEKRKCRPPNKILGDLNIDRIVSPISFFSPVCPISRESTVELR